MLVEDGRSRVLDLDILVEAQLFPHYHELVNNLEVDLGIDEGHITTKWLEQLLGLVILIESVANVSVEALDKIIKFIVTLSRI
jgi:hypothetical protein